MPLKGAKKRSYNKKYHRLQRKEKKEAYQEDLEL